MSDYNGKECLVCGKKFAENDDIVVCPECGTPYHRECYLEKGECINYELHENGGSWSEQQSAAQQRRFDEGESIKCPRCGGENTNEALFCNYCGLPLGVNGGAQQSFNDSAAGGGYGNGQQGMPGGFPGMQGMPGGFDPMFGIHTQRFTPESDIDGNTLGEYASYVSTNRGYFMTQFIRFSKFAKKASFSFVAFLFPQFYFFYRKMFKEGIGAFILTFLTSMSSYIMMFHKSSKYVKDMNLIAAGMGSLVNDINLKADWFVALDYFCFIGSWAVMIACGLFANFWYYKKAKKDISRIKQNGGQNEAIAAKGGTSFALVLVAFFMYLAVSVLFLLAVHYRADILAMLK